MQRDITAETRGKRAAHATRVRSADECLHAINIKCDTAQEFCRFFRSSLSTKTQLADQTAGITSTEAITKKTFFMNLLSLQSSLTHAFKASLTLTTRTTCKSRVTHLSTWFINQSINTRTRQPHKPTNQPVWWSKM